jgi:glutamyl-tRNA reductase
MARQIFAAEINFQDTPRLVREKFVDSEKNLKRLLSVFRRRVDEVFIFSNKRRFTVYIVHKSMRPLMDFFHDEHPLKGYVQFYYNTSESVTHLMATTSGLLAPVKGDPSVLDEVRKCYELACASSTIGMTLDHAIRRALETGKAVRTKTGIDKFCLSVVDTGIELLYNRLQDMHRMNYLVIGTGEVAKAALDSIAGEGIKSIVIAGHNAVAARRLAEAYNVRCIDISQLPTYLADAGVVISASHKEISAELQVALKDGALKGSEDRIILDFNFPSNFDPDTVGMLAEEYYNLDDLRRIQRSPFECFGGIEAAWRMVLKSSTEFALLLQFLRSSPALNAYLTRQFAMKNTELRLKPKRTIRNILSFLKDDNIPGTASVEKDVNLRLQENNHFPEDAVDVVRNTKGIGRFNFFLAEN